MLTTVAAVVAFPGGNTEPSFSVVSGQRVNAPHDRSRDLAKFVGPFDIPLITSTWAERADPRFWTCSGPNTCKMRPIPEIRASFPVTSYDRQDVLDTARARIYANPENHETNLDWLWYELVYMARHEPDLPIWTRAMVWTEVGALTVCPLEACAQTFGW